MKTDSILCNAIRHMPHITDELFELWLKLTTEITDEIEDLDERETASQEALALLLTTWRNFKPGKETPEKTIEWFQSNIRSAVIRIQHEENRQQQITTTVNHDNID